jgi:hypothetical protein
MHAEGIPQGSEIRLAPRGAGRWFSAAFLLVWLCGWALGEAFALWFLIKGAIALLSGNPPDPGREPLEVGPAVAIGAFLILWLLLWTVGGIAAMAELLRLTWAEDRLAVRGGSLIVQRRRGPFRTVREIGRDTIRHIALAPRNDRLVVETDRSTVEVSTLGTRDERAQAIAVLRAGLGLSEATAARDAALPEGWQEIITLEGERALVPDLATRRTQARVASVVTLGAAAVTFLIGRAALGEPSLFALAFIALAATIALGWGAVWLARGRNEWRIGSGRLTLRRRYGAEARQVFEARRLEITVSSDSDGDDWFELAASSEIATELPAPQRTAGRPKHRRTITRAMSDASTPRRLGAWLARATGMTLEDHSAPEFREAEVARLREQLAGSGPFGKWAVKSIGRLEERRRENARGD